MRTARLRVDSIAAGGDGVGRSEGLAVFVPRTAPGDLVDVTLDVRGRFARGQVTALLEPSPDRVAPPCVHYTRDRCGGCQLQHLAYGAQLAAKRTIVRDALQRIGHRDVADFDVRPSPSEWAYRMKLTLALRWVGGRWMAGLHPYDAADGVFQLEECLITDDRVVDVWRGVFAAAELLPRARSLRGAVRLTPEGAAFILEGGTQWSTAVAFADRVPALRAIWWERAGGRRRLVVDRRTAQSPDASFAQVNPRAAALLHTHVVETTMAHDPTTVVDAYAGAGATAIALADRGVGVTAIELDRPASRWTATRLPEGSRAIAARVEDVLHTTLPADVVIVNPPRAGLDARVTGTLQESRSSRPPRAIVYVSCNPATLARDLGRLPGFRIASMEAFDMFPQTAHVETVCELVPEAA